MEYQNTKEQNTAIAFLKLKETNDLLRAKLRECYGFILRFDEKEKEEMNFCSEIEQLLKETI